MKHEGPRTEDFRITYISLSFDQQPLSSAHRGARKSYGAIFFHSRSLFDQDCGSVISGLGTRSTWH